MEQQKTHSGSQSNGESGQAGSSKPDHGALVNDGVQVTEDCTLDSINFNKMADKAQKKTLRAC